MPRAATPIPPITAVPRDLSVEDVRTIIERAERAQERRVELKEQLKAALAANNQVRVAELARALVGLEEGEQQEA